MSHLRLWAGVIKDEILARPGRSIAILFFILLYSLPMFTSDPYYLRFLILSMIFALFAASWDVLSGFTGQLNLGHALFFGIGGYTAGMLSKYLHFPPYITISVGAVAAILVGLLVCLPALRLRGFYLGLVTMAFPIILLGLIFAFPQFTGGELGIIGIEKLVDSRTGIYYIVLIVFSISILIMWKFTDAASKIFRTGVILHAIREDEIATKAAGINTVKYKMLAFALSAFFSGIAGGLYVHFMRISAPSTLDLMLSFQAILWTIFGGIATIYGSVLGVFTLYPLLEILSLTQFGGAIRHIVLAVILICTLIFMPEGIGVWILDKIQIKCPRCKVLNAVTRNNCRACRALLEAKPT